MIVKMKKAKIVVLKEDKDLLLQSLQRYGELMLIPISEEIESIDTSQEDALINRTVNTLNFLKKYREKKKLFGDYSVVDYDEFIDINPNHQLLVEQIENANEEIQTFMNQNDAITEEINFLLPWKDLKIKVSDLITPKYAYFHTGFVEMRFVSQVISTVENYGGIIEPLGKVGDGQAVVFACYYEDNEELLNIIKNLGYLETKLPDEDRLIGEIILEKEHLIERNLLKIEELENSLKELSLKANELELLNDQMISLTEIKKAHHLQTIDTVYLEGWVRVDRLDRLEKAVRDATDIYDLNILEPLPDEIPPTVTKNNAFVSPFETITDMFAKPAHNEVDPNPVMSIWYWIIFGLMMGDAGYGLTMAIIFFTMIKVMKPQGGMLKLLKILLYSGITTIGWGIVFGSYFGFSLSFSIFGLKFPLIEPMQDPLKMLILSFVIGGLHIISGILMKAYDNFRQGKYFSMVVDQFTWVMVLVGLGMLFIPSTASAGKIMALTSAVIILLTAGREKKNIFGKVTGGFLNLYGIVNYISDILSYSRILALSLSSAVIAMVMNLLAGMIQGSVIGIILSIFIYVIGHLFNIAMGLLSAYVHDSRLQYIEFFGKFYEGGGYEFKPLSLKLKYINEVSDDTLIN